MENSKAIGILHAVKAGTADVFISKAAIKYCHEDFDKCVKPIEKNGHAFIHFGMNGWCLELSAKGWHGEAKINYCPMCGRKLGNG